MLQLLEAQLDTNGKLIANVSTDKLSVSTPCTRFDAKNLINHMVLANKFFVTVASGTPMEDPGDEMPDVLGEDPAGAHQASETDLLETLRSPGVLDRTFNFGFAQMPGAMALGMMLMETTVHGWDLAKATGQDASIDPEIATMLLAGAQSIAGMRSPDGNPFGPEVKLPETAPPGDRLIAFLGRTP